MLGPVSDPSGVALHESELFYLILKFLSVRQGLRDVKAELMRLFADLNLLPKRVAWNGALCAMNPAELVPISFIHAFFILLKIFFYFWLILLTFSSF